MKGAPKSAAELPLCPSFGRCGACSLLDVPYAEQLAAKQQTVVEAFTELASPEVILPIKGMDEPYHYRNKVISPFVAGPRRGRSGRTILTGMYVKGTHRLVSTDGCLVENVQANAVVAAVRELMVRRHIEPYNEDTGAGFLRHVLVRVGHSSGEVLVTLVTNGNEFPSSRAFCRELVKRCPFITTIVQNVNTRSTNVVLGNEERTLYGPGFILDTLCGLSFRISSHSFYQVNAGQTEVLYRTAVEFAQLSGDELVIDAYCGTGTIGLVAARRLQEQNVQNVTMGGPAVIGVDSQASSIRDARQNARHNGITNAQFTVGDAGAYLHKLAENPDELTRGDQRTVLFMDPPRAGASGEFLEAVGAFQPDMIVYISCAIKTQARDVRILESTAIR